MSNLKRYLIQGFFFLKSSSLELSMGPEGSGVVIKTGLFRNMYSGIIFPDHEKKNELVGEMVDNFGKSRIFCVKLSEKDLRFIKKYDNQNYLIGYSFKRRGELWIGKYSGKETGEGDTKCIITEVPPSLFYPKNKK
jgi:hypothetical protein